MLKKRPEPSASEDATMTEDEHAYEGAWYRSLKAKALRRAEHATHEPKRDEPEETSDEEPGSD